MRFYTLLFLPLVISQPCMPSIRPLQHQNIPSLPIPCPDSLSLIPYLRPSLKSTYLRSKVINDNDIQEKEDNKDIEYIEIY